MKQKLSISKLLSKCTSEQNTTNAPKSSRFISVSQQLYFLQKEQHLTTFGSDKYLEHKGIEAYSTNCNNDKNSISIVLKISKKLKTLRCKTSISQTLENIEINYVYLKFYI